jgi:hypothetical protein
VSFTSIQAIFGIGVSFTGSSCPHDEIKKIINNKIIFFIDLA